MKMKTTRFNEIHKSYGGKMVEFAGYEMPVQYPQGIIHEHLVVRNAVGVFDVSHMGEFEVRGKDALNFIQYISTNDASKLVPYQAQYSAMCYSDGGIVDDMIVYNLKDYYMLVVNGANIDKDWEWCNKNKSGFDIELLNETDAVNLLAVQGPKSLETMQKLTDVDLSKIEYYHCNLGKLANHEMIISRTGYTGEIGFEIYFRGDDKVAKNVWEAIFKAGEEFGIEPIGLGARDTLRLEKGYCLYGNDIDQTTNPLEAGLGWITKLSKDNFIGKDAIMKVKADGIKRKLVGMISDEKGFIPRHHYPIYSENNEELGEVTSGNISPILNKPIAMGYVKIDFANPGQIAPIEARGKKFAAKIAKFPFV